MKAILQDPETWKPYISDFYERIIDFHELSFIRDGTAKKFFEENPNRVYEFTKHDRTCNNGETLWDSPEISSFIPTSWLIIQEE
jgi:hypothetical protein